MTETTQPLWYQLGFALEKARREPTRERLRVLGQKLSAFRSGDQGEGGPRRVGKTSTNPPQGQTPSTGDGSAGREVDAWDGLVATAGGALVAAVLKGWRPRHDPGVATVARAAAAGAASAVLVELGRRVLQGGPGLDVEALPKRLLSGAGRGLVFGAVAEPRLPGPALLRGLAWGGAEFLVSPLGGLPRFLLRHTPYGRIPLVRGALQQGDEGDGDLLEHLVFGIALALMAGSD